jgi:transcriptional regulator with XRE-family HTH domain
MGFHIWVIPGRGFVHFKNLSKMAKAKHIDDFEAAYHDDSIDSLMAGVTPEQQEETDVKMLLASKIYKAMKGKGWTQTRFAEEANQHMSVISKWLSGTHNFTVETLLNIQRLLGIRLMDIEGPDTSVMFIKLSITSSTISAEGDIHKWIYENGGMAASGIEVRKESYKVVS